MHNGPGSGVDVTARFVNGLFDREKLLPVRAVVVNKPGGSGTVAAAYMTEKKDAELVQSAVEFIAQRRQIFKEAGIQTYR